MFSISICVCAFTDVCICHTYIHTYVRTYVRIPVQKHFYADIQHPTNIKNTEAVVDTSEPPSP